MKNAFVHFLQTFKRFSPEEINAVAEHTQLEYFKKGTTLLSEGQLCRKCFFVVKGCLRQYQIIDGEEKTTAFFTEGEAAVLYSAYLEERPSKHYLSAIEDAVLTTGTRIAEKRLHEKYPRLESLISAIMPQDYDKTQAHVELLAHYHPEERYRILLNTRPELFKRVPLYFIASYIGVTPESLSRIRKRMLAKEKRQ